MFFLSKFLPIFVMPLGITILICILFSINKKKPIFLLIPLFLSIFSNGITSEYLWRYLEYPWKRLSIEEMPVTDAIVVLSQKRHLPPGDSNIIEWWHDPDRFISGIMLLKASKAPKLIFTGGASPYLKELPPEGDLYKKEAILLGMPEEKILTTKSVNNTFEESIAVKSILKKGKPTILLVTSAFHMKRSKRLFEKQKINVIPYPVDFISSRHFNMDKLLNPYNFLPNATSLHSSSNAIREILGRIVYRSF